MDYTTLLLPSDANIVPETVIMTSLYETFQQFADARRGQGKRYELALILCLLVLAKMAGQTSLSAATEWIRHRAAVLAEHFRLRRQRMPCQMTYCNMLACVDGKHLDELLAAFFVQRARPAALWSGTEPFTDATRTGRSRTSGDRWQNSPSHHLAAACGASAQLL